jgi:hypothetical protein
MLGGPGATVVNSDIVTPSIDTAPSFGKSPRRSTRKSPRKSPYNASPHGRREEKKFTSLEDVDDDFDPRGGASTKKTTTGIDYLGNGR